MKRVVPDVGQMMVSRYLTKKAYLRKFVRYWGTTTVNGEEVLVDRNFYYPVSGQTDNFKKFAKHIGVWDDVKDPSMSGVDNAWFFINPEKFDTTDLTGALIASNLDLAMQPEGLDLVVTIGAEPESFTAADLTSLITNQTGLATEIVSKFATLWTTNVIGSNVPNDIYRNLLARYILLSSDVPYTISEITNNLVEVSREFAHALSEESFTRTQLVKSYSVKVHIPYIDFIDTTDIVTLMLESLTAPIGYNNTITKTALTSVTSRIIWGDEGTYTSYTINPDPLLWTTLDDRHYLKTSAFTSNDLTLDQKIDLVNQLVDTDYSEENAGMLGQILAIVVFVIAVILAKPTGGASLTLTQLAFIVTVAALVVTLTAAALNALGYEDIAASFSKFSQGIEPLVMVARIILLVDMLSNIGTKLVKSGAEATASNIATEYAATTGVDLTASQVTYITENLVANEFTNMVWAGIKSEFTNLIATPITDISMNSTIKMVNRVFDAYQKNELDQLRSKIKDARAENEAYAEEQSKVSSILMDINKANYSPMKADWSIYAEMYDLPYEHWSTKFHTGCIQANTVNALWLADKKDGII